MTHSSPFRFQKILSFFLGTILSFGIFQFSATLFAQEPAANPPAPAAPANAPSAENLACIETMTPFLATEQKNFLAFIQQHFKTTLANSALTDDALQRYQNYRAVVYKKFYEVIKYSPAASTQIDRLAELQVCETHVKQNLTIAEQYLRNHVRGTTAAKRTTALLEKLQAINSKLRGMNTNIGELRGYFAVLEHKLPFFISQCL